MKKSTLLVLAAAAASVGLTACGGSGDDAKSSVTSAASSAAASATQGSSSASSSESASGQSTSTESTSTASSDAASPSESASTGATSAAAGGDVVRAAAFKNAPKQVGRWHLATTVAPTETSAVYNDGTGVGANYDVSADMTDAQARERIKTQVTNIPGGFCGVGTADNALCFLHTDAHGMVTASATASNPADNIKVSKEFAQALYAATK